jgi:hypothetical protein
METEPVSPLLEDPDATLKEPVFASELAVVILTPPLYDSALRPLLRFKCPPVCVVLSPAMIKISEDVSLADPPEIFIPPAVCVESPELIVTEPDDPADASPLFKDKDPEKSAPSVLMTETEPEASCALVPEAMEIAPPVLALESPAVIETAPPSESEAEPAIIEMEPLFVEAEAVAKSMLPELSAMLAPVKIRTLPLSPVCPAFDVEILTCPLDVATPELLLIEISPPLPFSLLPLVTLTLPPSPASVFPARSVTPPPVPEVEAPTAIAILPALLPAAFPTLISIPPELVPESPVPAV